jgi:hypothetical protein
LIGVRIFNTGETLRQALILLRESNKKFDKKRKKSRIAIGRDKVRLKRKRRQADEVRKRVIQ